jgi:hypothetical protein
VTSADLPFGWRYDFRGRRSAVFRREATGVALIVEPRYEVHTGRSRGSPASYRVLLRRPYRQGRANPPDVVLGQPDDFETALSLAREYMEGYNDRRGAPPPDPARSDGSVPTPPSGEALAAAREFTDPVDLFSDLLETTFGDRLRGAWRVEGDAVTTLVADERLSPSLRSGERLTEAFSAVDTGPLSDSLDERVRCVAVTLEGRRAYRFLAPDGSETVVLVALSAQHPGESFVRDACALLADGL